MSLHQTPSHTAREIHTESSWGSSSPALAPPKPLSEAQNPSAVPWQSRAMASAPTGTKGLSFPLLRSVLQCQLTQTFPVVSSCCFILFHAHIPFVSTLAPPWGQRLSHLWCSLLAHGSTQPGQGLSRSAQHLPLPQKGSPPSQSPASCPRRVGCRAQGPTGGGRMFVPWCEGRNGLGGAGRTKGHTWQSTGSI